MAPTLGVGPLASVNNYKTHGNRVQIYQMYIKIGGRGGFAALVGLGAGLIGAVSGLIADHLPMPMRKGA